MHCVTPFEEVLGQYLSSGLMHSTPSIFLLAREVHWDNVQKEIIEGRPNAWFVELAASAGHSRPVKEFMRVASRYHKWALWYRASKSGNHHIHAYRWHMLARRVGL